MKPKLTDAERLAQLKAKRDQFQARISQLEARKLTEKRASRNRALALLGVLLESDLKKSGPADVEPLVVAAKDLLRPTDADFLSEWLRSQFGADGQERSDA